MRIQDDECRTNRIQKDFRLLNARVQNQICRNIEDFAIEANLVIPDKKNDRLDFLASDFGDRFCTYGDTPRETVVKRAFAHEPLPPRASPAATASGESIAAAQHCLWHIPMRQSDNSMEGGGHGVRVYVFTSTFD